MSNSKSPVITKNLLKLLEDVVRKEEFNEEIKLIANSGIQFVDYELDSEINVDDHDEKLNDVYDIVTQNKFVLVTRENTEGSDINSCTFARFRPHQSGEKYYIDERLTDPTFTIEKKSFKSDSNKQSPSVMDSVRLYNGIWFPIPYYPKGHNSGPTNFARARITRVGNSTITTADDIKQGKFHVTIAIDTKVDNTLQSTHGAPSLQDIDYAFTFRSGFEATELLRATNSDGISFVDEWTKSILDKILPEIELRLNDDKKQEFISNKIYQKHYLNVLAFLDAFFKPNDIKLVQCDKDHCDDEKIVDVSLILDVGNTRTCGLLVEGNNGQTSDTFPNSTPLTIRDLNCPENSYTGDFESKIQFQKANFDFNNCSDLSSRLDAFVWPSLVRVGPEASKLSSLLKGNEGKTGLVSPKRSLWQLDKSSKVDEWKFNNSYYQIPLFKQIDDDSFDKRLYIDGESSKSAIYQPVTGYLNSLGDALFATADKSCCMEANYTGKSTMTFMLVEIILQAMMQMNSYFYRKNMEYRDLPRRLKALVLTTPPSMPDVEKEIFRSCAYQALGIIWKAYGYDKTDATEFHFISKKDQMFPTVPDIFLKWDEVLACQIVYLYNETQRIYNGKSVDFIKDIRRPDADGRFNEIPKIKNGSKYCDSVSARIASIDIGGGTTDLVIADYSIADVFYKDLEQLQNKENGSPTGNQTSSIQIREVLKDGFKIAGDDLVYELLEKPIKSALAKEDDSYWDKLFGEASAKGAKEFQSRVQVVDKIFTKVAYRLISRLEQLDNIDVSKLDTLEVKIKGTIKEFVQGSDKFALDDLNNQENLNLPFTENLVFAESIVSYIEEKLPISFEEFLNIPLEFDLFKINYDISRGEIYDMCKNINYLNAIVNVYRCDVLLLTGRPTKIPGIRSLIERKSSLSSRRIIPMYDYKCEGWYPTFDTYDGRIGDPKTSVVVGALLGYTKEKIDGKLINFMLDIDPIPATSPMRYLGALDRDNELEDNEILYLFQSKAEENEQKGIIKDVYDPKSPKEYENFRKQYNESDKTIFTKPRTNTTSDLTKSIRRELPCNLGYRQFNNSLFKANMYFVLDTYEKESDLLSIKSISSWGIKGEIELSEEGLKQLKQPDNLIGLMNKTKDKLIDERSKEKIKSAVDSLEKTFREKIEDLNAFIDSEKNKVSSDLATTANNSANVIGKNKLSWREKFFGSKKKNEAVDSVAQEHIQANQQEREIELQRKISEHSFKLLQEFNRFVGKTMFECKSVLTKAEKENLERIRRNKTCRHEYEFSLKRLTPNDDSTVDKLEQNPIFQCINFVCKEYEIEDRINIFENIFILGIGEVKDITVEMNNNSGNSDEESNVTDYINLKLQTVSSVDCEYWNNTGKI